MGQGQVVETADSTSHGAGVMTASATVVDCVDELHEALTSDDAFDAWYRRTAPRVHAYLMRRCGNDAPLADELLQETLIATIDRRSRFEPGSDVVRGCAESPDTSSRIITAGSNARSAGGFSSRSVRSELTDRPRPRRR